MSQNPLFVYVPMVHTRPIRETAPAEARTVSNTRNTILPELIDHIAAEFIAGLKPDTFKRMKTRLARGLKMAKDGSVSVTDEPGKFLVKSAGVKNRQYEVDLDARTCTCPDSRKGNSCKHRIASYYIQQALFQSAPDQEDLAVFLIREESCGR